MAYFKKITGENLYLSPVDKKDSEIFIKWMNNDEVALNFGQYHQVVASENNLEWLFNPPQDIQRFSIVLNEMDMMIGCISIQNIDHLNRNAFIGIFIGEQVHRNKGYGGEAIKLMLNYGYNTLNLNNIMLSVNADNIAAITFYMKVGFHEVGRRHEWVFKNGQYIDKIYMDILAREFNN